MNSKFCNLSLELTSKLSKIDKQKYGIYFSSREIVSLTFKNLKDTNKYKTILEPSCGSGEFLNYINENYPNTKTVGVEYNKEIYDKIVDTYTKHNTLINSDFLKYNTNYTKKFDLIVGNPPYYVIKKDTYPEFNEFILGRPNIFCLFIIHSLKMLNENGTLAFIIPRNFLNSIYYTKIREYIVLNYTILNVKYIETDFLETKQEVIIIYIQNTTNTNLTNLKYYLNLNNIYFISNESNILKLKELTKNSTTLNMLGCTVTTGSVVWNQVKECLTDDNTKTLLIYSQNIENNQLNLTKETHTKKQYINKEGIYNTCLLLNRGYGTGKYTFKYSLYNSSHRKILVENHVNVIYNEDIEILKKIQKSFDDKRTKEFIENYFYNNGISKSELLNILPIYNEYIL